MPPHVLLCCRSGTDPPSIPLPVTFGTRGVLMGPVAEQLGSDPPSFLCPCGESVGTCGVSPHDCLGTGRTAARDSASVWGRGPRVERVLRFSAGLGSELPSGGFRAAHGASDMRILMVTLRQGPQVVVGVPRSR